MNELGDILFGYLEPGKEVIITREIGLTELAVSNEGETGRKLIMYTTKTYLQKRRKK